MERMAKVHHNITDYAHKTNHRYEKLTDGPCDDSIFFAYCHIVYFYGTQARKAGHGGDGEGGGFGGYPEKAFIVGIDQPPKFSIQRKSGAFHLIKTASLRK